MIGLLAPRAPRLSCAPFSFDFAAPERLARPIAARNAQGMIRARIAPGT
jgi:hypothetical protein